MKYIFILCVIGTLSSTSCKRSAESEPSKDQQTLYQRFHGKYRIISSVADQTVDLNMDGVASNHFRDELPDFANCDLELRIATGAGKNLFLEYWPEPYFGGSGGAVPSFYDPSVTIGYARQGVIRTFAFSSDVKTVLLDPDDATLDQQRYTRPSSIKIQPTGIIEVIKTKRFYTLSGWKEVRVVTLYERYTMTT